MAINKDILKAYNGVDVVGFAYGPQNKIQLSGYCVYRGGDAVKIGKREYPIDSIESISCKTAIERIDPKTGSAWLDAKNIRFPLESVPSWLPKNDPFYFEENAVLVICSLSLSDGNYSIGKIKVDNIRPKLKLTDLPSTGFFAKINDTWKYAYPGGKYSNKIRVGAKEEALNVRIPKEFAPEPSINEPCLLTLKREAPKRFFRYLGKGEFAASNGDKANIEDVRFLNYAGRLVKIVGNALEVDYLKGRMDSKAKPCTVGDLVYCSRSIAGQNVITRVYGRLFGQSKGTLLDIEGDNAIVDINGRRLSIPHIPNDPAAPLLSKGCLVDVLFNEDRTPSHIRREAAVLVSSDGKYGYALTLEDHKKGERIAKIRFPIESFPIDGEPIRLDRFSYVFSYVYVNGKLGDIHRHETLPKTNDPKALQLLEGEHLILVSGEEKSLVKVKEVGEKITISSGGYDRSIALEDIDELWRFGVIESHNNNLRQGKLNGMTFYDDEVDPSFLKTIQEESYSNDGVHYVCLYSQVLEGKRLIRPLSDFDQGQFSSLPYRESVVFGNEYDYEKYFHAATEPITLLPLTLFKDQVNGLAGYLFSPEYITSPDILGQPLFLRSIRCRGEDGAIRPVAVEIVGKRLLGEVALGKFECGFASFPFLGDGAKEGKGLGTLTLTDENRLVLLEENFEPGVGKLPPTVARGEEMEGHIAFYDESKEMGYLVRAGIGYRFTFSPNLKTEERQRALSWRKAPITVRCVQTPNTKDVTVVSVLLSGPSCYRGEVVSYLNGQGTIRIDWNADVYDFDQKSLDGMKGEDIKVGSLVDFGVELYGVNKPVVRAVRINPVRKENKEAFYERYYDSDGRFSLLRFEEDSGDFRRYLMDLPLFPEDVPEEVFLSDLKKHPHRNVIDIGDAKEAASFFAKSFRDNERKREVLIQRVKETVRNFPQVAESDISSFSSWLRGAFSEMDSHFLFRSDSQSLLDLLSALQSIPDALGKESQGEQITIISNILLRLRSSSPSASRLEKEAFSPLRKAIVNFLVEKSEEICAKSLPSFELSIGDIREEGKEVELELLLLNKGSLPVEIDSIQLEKLVSASFTPATEQSIEPGNSLLHGGETTQFIQPLRRKEIDAGRALNGEYRLLYRRLTKLDKEGREVFSDSLSKGLTLDYGEEESGMPPLTQEDNVYASCIGEIPLSRPDMFFGRKEEIKEALSLFARGNGLIPGTFMVLWGQRRCGKSTFLRFFELEIEAKFPEAIVISIHNTPQDREDLLYCLQRECFKHIKKALRNDPDLAKAMEGASLALPDYSSLHSADDWDEAFRDFFYDFTKDVRPVLVFIDEFQNAYTGIASGVVRSGFVADFFQSFLDAGLSALLIGGDFLSQFWLAKNADIAVRNKFNAHTQGKRFFFDYLDPDSAKDMMDLPIRHNGKSRYKPQTENACKKRILRLTGGNPLFVMRFMAALVTVMAEKEAIYVSERLIEDAVDLLLDANPGPNKMDRDVFEPLIGECKEAFGEDAEANDEEVLKAVAKLENRGLHDVFFDEVAVDSLSKEKCEETLYRLIDRKVLSCDGDPRINRRVKISVRIGLWNEYCARQYKE